MQIQTPQHNYDIQTYALSEKAKLLEWDAGFYQTHSEMQHMIGRETIRRLHLVDGADIFDIGCGDGRLTTEIAKKIPRGTVTGIDISANMLRRAQANLTDACVENCRLLKMRAEDIRFDSEFDGIFSNIAVQWVRKQRALFQTLFRALRTGGKVAIATCYDSPELDDEGEPLKRENPTWYNIHVHEIEDLAITEICNQLEFRPFLPRMNFQPQQFFYSVPRIRRNLETAGFSNISLTTQNFQTKYDNLDEYLTWGMDAYFDIYPVPLQTLFLEKYESLMKVLLENAPDRPANFEYVDEWSVLFIQAEKL